CTTFLLLIRITFEPQLIETFVDVALLESYLNHKNSFFGRNSISNDANYGNFTGRNQRLLIYWVLIMKERSYSGANQKRGNADYHKEFIHYYCCIGRCCSTGTEAEAWRFFWGKLEDVALLELNLKHGAFFLMGEIYLSMEVVVEGIGGCCSTGAESKTCKLFFERNLFRINASYDSETRINASYDKESRHYCCCFGGCCSTGAESGEWRPFWKKVEDVPILQLNLKHKSSSVMDYYSTETESRAWNLLWKELKAVGLLELNRERVNFSFKRNSFRINASYDSETRHYCCCFGGCCSIGTESEALGLFWKKLENVPILQLILKQRSSSERDYYSTGTESRAWKLLWKELEAVALLELNQKRVNFFLGGIHLELMLVTIVKLGGIHLVIMLTTFKNPEETGGCCSTGAQLGSWEVFWNELGLILEETGGCYSTKYGAWKLIWKELEVVALLELNQKMLLNCILGIVFFQWFIQMVMSILEFKNEHEEIYNICISFPGISKECEFEVKSYTDYLVKNKIEGFDVGQSADILYRANGCSNDYSKSLGIKYVFTIEIRSRKMYNFGFMIPKSYISKLAEEVFA
uniref:Peptidase M14 domain-containing protein n=1 Tax=Strongyloides stercoralis TaxID=6248 RepID=A0AAF5CY63_STRER